MQKSTYLMIFMFLTAVAPLAGAEVNVSISIGVPPPLVFSGPPELIVVPGGAGYVYMVPDIAGVYFYRGRWYRIHDGHWFRATIYSGPWSYVPISRVPRVIVNTPLDHYRTVPPGYYRIPYGDLHSHWRAWDNGKHWHRYDWYRHQVRDHQQRRREKLYRQPHPEQHQPPGEGRKYRGGQKPHHQQGPRRTEERY